MTDSSQTNEPDFKTEGPSQSGNSDGSDYPSGTEAMNSPSSPSPQVPEQSSWGWSRSEIPANGYGQFDTGSWQNPSATPSFQDSPTESGFASPQSAANNVAGFASASNTPPASNGLPSSGSQPGFDQYALNFQQVQPGIIPLRPLTLGDIYNGSFAALRQAPSVMFGLILGISGGVFGC